MCIRDRRKTMDKVDDLKCVEIENPFKPGEKVVAVPAVSYTHLS